MGVNCSCAAEDLELKQKDLKENADTVKQDNDEAIREIHFANAQPILNDTGAEAFADEDDKRNSDKAIKKEEDDEPKSTTSKESAWNRRDFFLQSSANVLTNALCAVIENPGDFQAFYTVKEKVGAGQFGTVSAAVITANGAERAVKTVEKKAQRSFLTALRAEMEIMKVLDHPNLITICEIFENSENIILAMKLCKGPHLTQYVERVASLSEKQASFVMRDLLRAVAYMHNSQVCHRDLKGENCLMLNQGPPERNRLKICDFGLSCKFEPGGFLSGRMGSVSHIGPEVLKSPDKYTHACDCWSCGIIFYHLICGFLPFHEEKEVLNNRLSFSDRHFCDFSEDGCRLISALVERDVQKRMSARDALSHKWFLEHLKDARSHGGDVQGSPMGTPQSNPSNGSAANPPSGYAERVVRFRGFNKWKQSALRVIANMLPENENNAAREFFLTLDNECRGQVPWATMCEACGFEDIDDAPKEDVRFTELLAATFERKKGLSEKMLKAAYQNYDKSGDGKVSLRDLREGRLIGPLTAKDFKRISRDIGENQPDDVVDFDGFVKMMRIDKIRKTLKAREAEKAAKAAKDGADESDCSGVADD